MVPMVKVTMKKTRRPAKKTGAMTARKVATIAKRAVMKTTETKKHSLEVYEDSLNTNGGIIVDSPLELQPGSGHGTRIGHKVKPVGIDIRGHVISNSQNFGLLVKMMVVREKNAAAAPTVDLLENNSGNVAPTTNDISKIYRRINADSYEVLYSKIMLIPTEPYKRARVFRAWINMRKFKSLTYEGTGIAPPTFNDVKIIFFGADAANDAANIPYEISYNATFYFKDP